MHVFNQKLQNFKFLVSIHTVPTCLIIFVSTEQLHVVSHFERPLFQN